MSEVLSHSSDDASSKKRRRPFRLFRKKAKSPTGTSGATKPTESPASPLVATAVPTTSPEPPTPLSPSPSLPKEPIQDRLGGKKSWLCQTKFFKDMISSSFDMVDQDGSGSVDEKELYSGLLLIHLKMGVYAGPAACKVRLPASSRAGERRGPTTIYDAQHAITNNLTFLLVSVVLFAPFLIF